MNNKEIIKKLVTADAQLELIINRFADLGLQLEPNMENPNAISTLIYETQTQLNSIILELAGFEVSDDVVRKEYYDVLGEICSVEDIPDTVSELVHKVLEV